MPSIPSHAPAPPRGRLAPSPTGALHLGNARSFLLAWLSIRSRNGSLVLRMEDLDHPKVKPTAADDAIRDLQWLGLDWDEGPTSQSSRKPLYASALQSLLEQHLAYPCTCSRKDVEAAQSAPHAGEDGLAYSGLCRNRFTSYEQASLSLPPGRLPAWRFRSPPHTPTHFHDLVCGPQSEIVADTIGDFAFARDPLGAGYMLACVVDDAAMGITEVLRGNDLLRTTHRQILLQQALHLPTPTYAHVPLVIAEDGHRLAKRHGDTRISALRDAGIPASRIIGLLAWWCGWADFHAHVHPAELLHSFNLQSLNPNPAILTPPVRHALGLP